MLTTSLLASCGLNPRGSHAMLTFETRGDKEPRTMYCSWASSYISPTLLDQSYTLPSSLVKSANHGALKTLR